MVGHGGSTAGSYLADPTSPIPSHCASIVATSTLRVEIRPPFCLLSILFITSTNKHNWSLWFPPICHSVCLYKNNLKSYIWIFTKLAVNDHHINCSANKFVNHTSVSHSSIYQYSLIKISLKIYVYCINTLTVQSIIYKWKSIKS